MKVRKKEVDDGEKDGCASYVVLTNLLSSVLERDAKECRDAVKVIMMYFNAERNFLQHKREYY